MAVFRGYTSYASPPTFATYFRDLDKGPESAYAGSSMSEWTTKEREVAVSTVSARLVLLAAEKAALEMWIRTHAPTPSETALLVVPGVIDFEDMASMILNALNLDGSKLTFDDFLGLWSAQSRAWDDARDSRIETRAMIRERSVDIVSGGKITDAATFALFATGSRTPVHTQKLLILEGIPGLEDLGSAFLLARKVTGQIKLHSLVDARTLGDSFAQLKTIANMEISGNPQLVTMGSAFRNLQEIDRACTITGNPVMQTLHFPALQIIGGNLVIQNNDSLRWEDEKGSHPFPALRHVDGNVTLSLAPGMTIEQIDAWMGSEGAPVVRGKITILNYEEEGDEEENVPGRGISYDTQELFLSRHKGN
jgi:hypothetical protein